MIVGFASIPDDGIFSDISETSWFPDDELERCAPVQGRVRLVRHGANQVEVFGEVTTGVRLRCDRCLVAYDFPLVLQLHVLLETAGAPSWGVREVVSQEEEPERMILAKPEVDLGDLLRQQLYLALPLKNLCSIHCRGLCATCGADLNIQSCNCEQTVGDPRFQILSVLKKN